MVRPGSRIVDRIQRLWRATPGLAVSLPRITSLVADDICKPFRLSLVSTSDLNEWRYSAYVVYDVIDRNDSYSSHLT